MGSGDGNVTGGGEGKFPTSVFGIALDPGVGRSNAGEMFRTIGSHLFSFDVEWIPDPVAAQRLTGASAGSSGGEIQAGWNALWQRGGATAENPQPYLKTILCRIVSICGVYRESTVDGPKLQLVSLPKQPEKADQVPEAAILRGFLKAVGRKKPQLVGYNSAEADIPIIVQRSIVHGLYGEGMGTRPEKPWEGVDYFANSADASIDLAPILGRFRQMPSLHEAAVLSGIPGKVDVSGGSVPEMWLQGRIREIVAYNEFDALTTHLLWARVAHFAGLLSKDAYVEEQEAVEGLIETEIANGKKHLGRFLEVWRDLRGGAIRTDS